ncbi:TetR/AcrR family transcriptional regulator [Amycolatopsis sp. NBC_01480]|uniref:TetR/AcrR family transcriptional regulator n=1 Tax=Amycolatopsis sp. NBC_01480 TaxID=2903562 RepID=UPI002E2B4414|nr:TetR/AcrR family transcriptional regulator [Amycolatopsis sp. NBC_01480]
MTETGKVPAVLARLWRLPAGPRLGRPAELDVDRVVRAAVDLADRDGLDGVTLLKVAQELGVTKMSLYRHVGSKGELFGLMADFATGAPPEIDAPDWREEARQWARAHRDIYRRRPWMVHLPVSGPPGGPHAIGWMDTLLRVLRGTGLDWATKVSVLNLLGGYVRQSALVTQQLAEGRRDSGREQAEIEQDYGRSLIHLVDHNRFPDAAELFASTLFEAPGAAAGDTDPGGREFEFGLDLILDGLAATIARVSAAG